MREQVEHQEGRRGRDFDRKWGANPQQASVKQCLGLEKKSLKIAASVSRKDTQVGRYLIKWDESLHAKWPSTPSCTFESYPYGQFVYIYPSQSRSTRFSLNDTNGFVILMLLPGEEKSVSHCFRDLGKAKAEEERGSRREKDIGRK